jgi:hypothetical protein
VGGWSSSLPMLRALVRGRAFRLMRRRSLEQCFQLLAYLSLLRGCWLRAAAQQHGCGGQVLGRSPEKRGGVSVPALTFAPSLARWSLLGSSARTGGVGTRSCG